MALNICVTTTKMTCYQKNMQEKNSMVQGSGSIVRLSMTASRAADPGSNPGRSTNHYISRVFRKKLIFNNHLLLGAKYAGGFGQQIINFPAKTEKALFSTMKYY